MFSYLDPPPRPEIPLRIAASERYHDPLVYIDRQTKHLQRQIQSFLDAQSDGLLASTQLQLGQDGNNDTPSKEGSVATASTVGSGERTTRTIPVRQPAKKKIGLRVARKGILRSMSDLLDLREEENRHLQARIHEREDAIQKADKFAQKRNGLLKTLSDLENDREGTEVRKLKKEANDLEEEIRELELKLVQMKNRHRSIIQEVSRIENAVGAKLSSYKESLAILETEIRRYLETHPIQPIQQGSSKSPFYSLHPSRRTLEMAREHWQSEKTQLEARSENVNAEIAALDDGGEVWQTVVKEITHLEKRLRTEMQQTTALLKSSTLTSSIDDDVLGRRVHEQKILEDLENTTRVIEKTLELAKAREWNLLVCSIGTEVAALHEAQNMLRQMYHHRTGRSDPEIEAAPGTARYSTHDLGELDQSENTVKANDVLNTDLATPQANNPSFMDQFSEHDEHADDPPADLLRDTMSEELNRIVSRSEDEDDEPDPAWLLSDP